MRKTLRLIAATLLAIPAVSYACATNESLIFSCTTKKMKAVEVCDAEKTIKYSYGKNGSKPELALSVSRNEVTTSQWDGMGSSMSYEVNIPNRKAVYTVYWQAERKPDGEVDAGIYVEVDGKNVANIECDMKTVEQNLEGVDLKHAE